MRIDRLHVSGSKTLRNAGINTLDMELPASISIILGTNGCGKSLTLSYLDPAPAPTTTFENWGRRDVVYQTSRGTYTVSTDYSLQSSPHQFFGPDGENLNVGQTSRMQEQLCESELGLDSFSIGLMMNKATLVKRTEGQRKFFLMNVAPSAIGFILDQQKEVERKIRDASANIVRLQERKLQLEQDLLSPDAILTLEEEEQAHQAFLEQVQKKLHIIEYEDQTDPPDLCAPDLEELAQTRKHIKSVSDKARTMRALAVNPKTIDDRIDAIKVDLSSKRGICSAREEQIVETRTTLSETQARIKELGVKAELEKALQDIDDISAVISRNESTPAPSMMITRAELQRCQETLRDVETALSDFLGLSVAIYSRQTLTRKKRFASQVQRDAKVWHDRIAQIDDELSELKHAQSVKPSNIPKPCSGMDCALYRACVKKEDRLSHQMRKLHDEKLSLEHKLGWVSRYQDCAKTIFAEQNDIQDKLARLWEQAKKNPVLQSLLRHPDVLHTLRHAPIKLYRDMTAILDQIAWSYQKNDLQDQLSTLHASVSRFKAAGEGDVVALEQSIIKEESRLSDQIHGLEMIEKEITVLDKSLTQLQDLKRNFIWLDNLEETLDRVKTHARKWIKRQLRAKMRADLKARQKEHLARIGDIRKVLRDQALLKSRYEEEVASELRAFEHKRTILRKVCHELTMTPREYMVPFVNSILTIVNKLIAAYWTQKIEFVLWDVNEELNYLFPHYKNGNLIKDMDMGSEGERDLFTLLFNIALRIVRCKTDLPLCLDEVGRTFDEKHKHNLVKLLTNVMDQSWATQLIIVNHDPMVHEGFLYADIIVLNSDNIHTPEVYNEHVSIS